MTASEFNERYSVGTSVRYHSVIGESEYRETATRSEAWTTDSGHGVVMVTGKAGYVSLEAITIDPEVETYSSLGRVIEKHALWCNCEQCMEFLLQGNKIHARGLHA